MVSQARYQLRVYDPWTGSQIAVLVRWRALSYVKQVNNFHTLQLTLDADDPNVRHFDALDTIVEVWRRITPGSDWYKDVVCLKITPQNNLYENGLETKTVYARGLNDLLHRRHIEYFANTAYTLKQGVGETIMKEFVTENCTSAGNISSRRSFGYYSPEIVGLTIPGTAGLGGTWRGAKAWQNLLDTLMDISLTTSVDFEIMRIGETGRVFEFRTFYPQRGTDRTNLITFSPELSNMREATVTESRTEEANAVAVVGQGQNDQRRTLQVIDAVAMAESPWNIKEIVTDARSQDDNLTSLQQQGRAKLAELSAEYTFEFAAVETASRRYGDDWDVGDIIRAKYRDIDVTKKIVSASIGVAEGKETIVPEFADFPFPVN